MTNDILVKIKKLLALGNSSNPNEAAIALERAQKLMRMYHISMGDVSLSDISESVQEIEPGLRANKLFMRLTAIITKAFGIKGIVNSTRTGNYQRYNTVTFIGPEDRVQAAIYTYVYLNRSAIIAKKAYSKKVRGQFKENNVRRFGREILEMYASQINNEVRKDVESYMMGWFSIIESKVQEFAVTNNETHLIKCYMDRKYNRTLGTTSSRKRCVNGAAYEQGMRDGANVALRHGVHGKESLKIGYY